MLHFETGMPLSRTPTSGCRNRFAVRRLAPLAIGFGLIATAGAQQFSISRYTIDGGGTTSANAGGTIELSGTIGQPDAMAAVMTGGRFEMTGGFWFPIVAGDCDEDGGVSKFDFANFADCATGPDGGPLSLECLCVDFDGDDDVDVVDFGDMQQVIQGP
ncbi:MAG: hypothetical protein HOP29_05555 [Phycisphaerales bacterium]|nr:hypothetical protein [Phycisphaerales bacterium]